MRIVHVSTYRHGGAGAAAWRLHKALSEFGVDSHFLSFEQKGNAKDHWTTINNSGKPLWQKIRHWLWLKQMPFVHRLAQYSGGIQMQKKFQSICKLVPAEYMSWPQTTFRLHRHPLLQSADIVHLHWVANVLDYTSFFQNIQKPVIWTLHDLNPIMGCFHFPIDQSRFGELMGELDTECEKIKMKAFKNKMEDLKFITPSKYFHSFVESKEFKKEQIHQIPNVIPNSIFWPKDKPAFRRKYFINQEEIVLLIVAARLDNYRKGFDIFKEAIALVEGPAFSVLAIGNESAELKEIPGIQFTGFVNQEEILAEYYSLADVVILPSREDNLPNVMLESLSCGTPVIGFNIGGLKDHIKTGFTGLLAPEMNAAALARTIEKFIENRHLYKSREISNYAVETFSPKAIAHAHMALYRSCI